jgi:hypothetical protein
MSGLDCLCLFETWVSMSLPLSSCLNLSAFVWRSRFYMFKFSWSIIFLSLFASWFEILNPLSNIMFYHILCNFEFELVCHMYIISLDSIMFELLCPIIQCQMSIVICVCLECAQCVLSSNSNSCCEQSPNDEKWLYSSLREFYTHIALYYIDDSAMCIAIELL